MMTVYWLGQCHSCVSNRAKLLITFNGGFPIALNLQPAKRWHKLGFIPPELFGTKYTLGWETASRCVSVALQPNGIAASWKKLKPSWNCCKVGLGWKLSQLSSVAIACFCAFGQGGKTLYQTFSWSWEVRNFMCLVFWNTCGFLGW